MQVSVIIPAYNAAATIADTLRSVQSQTMSDLEIIVVDDGSTDETPEILKQFAQQDARLKIVVQTNSGPSWARHNGLMHAQGEYITTLDSDDLWHPTKLEKQLALFARSRKNVAAVYCWSRIIDENSRVLGSQAGMFADGFILCRHVYENPVGNGSSIMARREAALAVGGFKDDSRKGKAQSADDHLFQLRLATRYRFGLVPEYLVGYRSVTGSVSANKNKLFNSIMTNLDAIRPHSPHVPEYAFRWSCAAALYDLIAYNVRRGDKLNAAKAALKSLRLDPEMFFDRLRLAFIKHSRQLYQAPGAEALRTMPLFSEISPTAAVRLDDGLHARRMEHLAKIDRTLSKQNAKASGPNIHVPGWA